jgi:hypothetical protein
MKRGTVITDRLGCAIAGAALVALGVSTSAWQSGRLPVPLDGTLTLAWLQTAVTAWWWPFALGIAAVALMALGLAWLFTHRPGQTLGSAWLPDSGPGGTLTVDVNTAAAAAAAHLRGQPGIAAASGSSLTDRGQRVVELDVTIDPEAHGLATSSSVLSSTRRDLAAVLNGVPVSIRILVRSPRHSKRSRVS